MRVFLTLLLCLGLAGPLSAEPGGWAAWLKKVFQPRVSTRVPRSAALEQAVASRALAAQMAHRAAWTQLNAKALPVPLNIHGAAQNMAAASSPSWVPATEAERRFKAVNDRLAQEWQYLTERDIAVMQRRKAHMIQTLRVEYPKGPVNYADLIPPEARFIAVGEEHGFAPLRRTFETLVWQYRKKYPNRKIVVLTEFVFDRTLPLSEKTGEPVSSLAFRFRRISPDFRFLEKFIKRGIHVIGLEDERYFRSHQALISPAFRQVESVYGMKQRNDHWRRIIAYVRRQEPEAVFFVYTGNLHVHYRAPFSLVKASPQVFVLQLMAQDVGTDLPFGAVMQQEPFAQVPAQATRPTVLTWPRHSPYSILSGFDACLVFPTGEK